MRPVLLLPSLFSLCMAAHSQEMARVEIAGGGAQQQRRQDSVGRVVIDRAELGRFGDASLADVLRRQPGIAIVDGAIQMRGLGGGRTPLMINGEAAPPGFSPDALAPALIERIEILRSASADSSTQGIAGSINIVLRKPASTTPASATLVAAHGQAGWFPHSAFELPLRGAAYSGVVAAHLARNLAAFDSHILSQQTGPGTAFARATHETGRSVTERAGLAPRLNWKFGGDHTLAWQSLIDASRVVNHGQAQESVLQGRASDYPRNHFDATARTVTLRSDANGALRLGDQVRFDWKAGIAWNRRDSDYLFKGGDQHATPRWQRHVLSDAADTSASSSGKWRYGAGADASHALALGWDGTRSRRVEGRRQRDADAGGATLAVLDQHYTAHVQRLALFAQDEWTPTPQLDLYIGLRWEGLRTRTEGRDLDRLGSSSGVWSPVAQVLYRLPGGRDQWRLGLAHTYKAPATRDLVPRRFTVNNDNGPGNPHVQGNPSLQPELAKGIDVAYEAYFGQAGMVSASAYGRAIEHVILPYLFEERGAWVSMPHNAGSAKVLGVELEARAALGPDGTMVRANLTRNWSTVAALPGPGNRLAEQTPLLLNLGLDYRVRAGLTAGLNWNMQSASHARTTATQWSERGAVRRLDVYGRWQVQPRLTIRVAAANLLAPSATSAVRQVDGGHDARRTVLTGSGRSVQFSAEVGL